MARLPAACTVLDFISEYTGGALRHSFFRSTFAHLGEIATATTLFSFLPPPADRYATIRRRCICIGRVFRARSVKSIDLEPCLKFTWVMSMKLERILIARLECSSSVYFCTGGKITSICDSIVQILCTNIVSRNLSFIRWTKDRIDIREFCSN